MVKLFVKSEQKWQWYYQKIRARVDSGIWKALKCTITPVVYKRSARSWWQTHKCVGSRLRCSKKFQKSMSELKNSRISCIRWTIGKSFPANQWKVYTAKVCILVVSICQMSSSPNGKPQTWNIFGFQKLILSISSDIKNQELRGEFFKSEQKMAQYRQETPCVSGSRPNKNDYHQETASMAWQSWIDTRLQYSPLVTFSVLLFFFC